MDKNVKLIIALIILVIIYFLTQQTSSTTSFDREFLSLDSASISKIQVIKNNSETSVEKINNEWMIENYKVDKNAINNAIKSLTSIEVGRLVTDKVENHERYEVNSEKGTTVKVTHGSETAEFIIGKQGASYQNLFVRKPDKDNVYSTVSNFKNNLDKQAKDWKDKTILTYDRNLISTLHVKNNESEFYVYNKDTIATIAGMKIKSEPEVEGNYNVTSMLTGFKNFNTVDFPKIDKSAFEKPELSITISLRDGGETKISAIKKEEDDNRYLLTVSNNETIFEVYKSTLDKFLKPYKDLKK